jgi:hypothetical protein
MFLLTTSGRIELKVSPPEPTHTHLTAFAARTTEFQQHPQQQQQQHEQSTIKKQLGEQNKIVFHKFFVYGSVIKIINNSFCVNDIFCTVFLLGPDFSFVFDIFFLIFSKFLLVYQNQGCLHVPFGMRMAGRAPACAALAWPIHKFNLNSSSTYQSGVKKN